MPGSGRDVRAIQMSAAMQGYKPHKSPKQTRQQRKLGNGAGPRAGAALHRQHRLLVELRRSASLLLLQQTSELLQNTAKVLRNTVKIIHTTGKIKSLTSLVLGAAIGLGVSAIKPEEVQALPFDETIGHYRVYGDWNSDHLLLIVRNLDVVYDPTLSAFDVNADNVFYGGGWIFLCQVAGLLLR